MRAKDAAVVTAPAIVSLFPRSGGQRTISVRTERKLANIWKGKSLISTLLVNQDLYPLTEASGRRYQEQFKNDYYVRFPSFFKPQAFELLCIEARRLRRQCAIRRDLEMKETEGTPRKMYTIGGDKVLEYSTIVPTLYSDRGLLSFLAGVAGEDVYEIPDPIENYAVNVLEQVGDVHGGHVDTHAFAFNLFVETPPKGAGGALEFVPGSTAIGDLDSSKVRRVDHDPGDCYFLRANEAVHRVAPLTRPGRRMIIGLGYANPATVNLQSYSTSVLYSSP